MADKNRYDVEIGNNNYVLKTKRSKEETDAIVKYVDTELESAENQLKYRNPAMHATLACLNIADTLFSISREYDDLKKKSSEPMKDYEPLKNKYQDLLTRANNSDQKISSLNARIEMLGKEKKGIEAERDKYKNQLEKQDDDSKKSIEEIRFLRESLIEQEKETLSVYKQLQEVLKRSENK